MNLNLSRFLRPIILAGCIITVAALYLWCVRLTGEQFTWNRDLDGYYDLLGRAFAQGHTYLPIQPAPELLRLADPWDPQQNGQFRLFDAVLYNGRYYIYHGVAPALLIFTPWRLLAGHDVPETFAVFLFCLFGYIFSCSLLIHLLSYASIRLPAGVLGGMLLTLGITQCVPYLLNRVRVYEVAIAGGYLCLSTATLFFAKAITTNGGSPVWTAASGIAFGAAAGCRPHFLLLAAPAGLLLLAWELRSRSFFKAVFGRAVICFVAPVVFCVLALLAYNYARYGNPMEFGVRYQLGVIARPKLHLMVRNLAPGLYYFLVCPPHFEGVFPFFRLVIRPPLQLPIYRMPMLDIIEPTIGILWCCPLALIALLSPVFMHRLVLQPALRFILWAIYLEAITCLFFIAATGWYTQRYEVDFLPYLVLLALILIAFLLGHVRKLGRVRKLTFTLSVALAGLAMFYSIGANLALAIQGPYNQFAGQRPESYVRFASWFAPAGNTRPLLNPVVRVEASFVFPESGAPRHEPLVSVGPRYALWADRTGANAAVLNSVYSDFIPDIRQSAVALSGMNHLRLDFDPRDRTMAVSWNGGAVMRHAIPLLITAPSQVKVAEEYLSGKTIRFSGESVVTTKTINGQD